MRRILLLLAVMVSVCFSAHAQTLSGSSAMSSPPLPSSPPVDASSGTSTSGINILAEKEAILKYLQLIPMRSTHNFISGQSVGPVESCCSVNCCVSPSSPYDYQKYFDQLKPLPLPGLIGFSYDDYLLKPPKCTAPNCPTQMAFMTANGVAQNRSFFPAMSADGSIVEITWNPKNPWTGNYFKSAECHNTSLTDLAAAPTSYFTTSLGEVKDALLDLQNRGIVVIWRPFGEETGTSFWWGRCARSPDDFAALWNTVYTYLTMNGVHNLIWTYAPSTFAVINGTPFAPSMAFYQKIASEVDLFFPDDYTDNTFVPSYGAAMDTGKVLGFGERGHNNALPTLVSQVVHSFPRMVLWQSWFDGGADGASNSIVSSPDPHGLLTNNHVANQPDVSAVLGCMYTYYNSGTSDPVTCVMTPP